MRVAFDVVDPRGRRGFEQKYDINGTRLRVKDGSQSYASRSVARDLASDHYRLDRIPFRPGDVVVDIGAHVGFVSIYLAKRHPDIRILAFEPWPESFGRLQHNLRINKVTNVQAFQLAVTADGRDVHLVGGGGNTGGTSIQQVRFGKHNRFAPAPSTTLDRIFDEHRIQRCRLLKVDCEGSEHELLKASRSLARVDYLSGEFHINENLVSQGHSIEGLEAHVARFLPRDRIAYVACRMAE